MFEIYCERVRDLLTTTAPPKGGLKVREDPKKGFYGLSNYLTVVLFKCTYYSARSSCMSRLRLFGY